MPPSDQPTPSRLARRLNTTDAVVLGLASMIGAGIFAAAGPAAAAAGTGLLWGVLLAGGIAYLNATTMAQLAAIHPESGGTYAYGRRRLGNFWGFLAGWSFVIGKLASCTAMALTFAFYAWPEIAKPLAVLAVLTLTLVNSLGIQKTAFASKVLLALVFAALIVVVFATWAGGSLRLDRLTAGAHGGGLDGILQSAGIMFFAFAGYARLATLGEEVINPRRTIPKAILIALTGTLALYLLVMTTVVLSVDITDLAGSTEPLALAVSASGWSSLTPLVRAGACVASLGVLLSLMAGISRTVFAMASNRELPVWLAAVDPTHQTPRRAEIVVGLIIACLISIADLRSAIGFSSFAILIYYAIANVAAWTLPQPDRLWPRWLTVAGFIACLTVAANLPSTSIQGGLLLFALGSGWYALIARKNSRA